MTQREKHIWNRAIEVAIARLRAEFVAPEVVIEIIEQVKK